MIVVDTSALVAVFLGEEDAEQIAVFLADSDVALSAFTYVEAAAVLSSARMTGAGNAWLDGFMRREAVVLEPVTATQAEIARAAYRRYGRGSGHSASLNLGDCFSYALAKDLNVPLLYKGNDFARTDIVSALA